MNSTSHQSPSQKEALSGRIFQIGLAPHGGVPKLPLGQATVSVFGLEGDGQAHPQVHGGPEAAVCLYSLERILALQAEGHPVFPGSTGENLTLSGLDWEQMIPGVRLRLGEEVLLEVTQYTTPCKTITPSFKDGDSNRIHQDRHPGWSRVYARVLQTGGIFVGNEVVQVEG